MPGDVAEAVAREFGQGYERRIAVDGARRPGNRARAIVQIVIAARDVAGRIGGGDQVAKGVIAIARDKVTPGAADDGDAGGHVIEAIQCGAVAADVVRRALESCMLIERDLPTGLDPE